ncbi:nuclear transport factor 2 family protein [Streptomyces sp. NPDC058964]|uniref:nuclear transport factor 2 family protein n=1 Tax=Streptomyces sp. NPDC058964 TaxID=3346681 RepID=UPI00367C7ACB
MPAVGSGGPLAEPDEAARQELLDRYVDAFTRADADALVELLRADAEMEMPPTPTWFTGRHAVIGFLAGRAVCRRRRCGRRGSAHAPGSVGSPCVLARMKPDRTRLRFGRLSGPGVSLGAQTRADKRRQAWPRFPVR